MGIFGLLWEDWDFLEGLLKNMAIYQLKMALNYPKVTQKLGKMQLGKGSKSKLKNINPCLEISCKMHPAWLMERGFMGRAQSTAAG